MAENYTALEALAIANAKGEIRKAKAKMKEINDKRDARVALERKAKLANEAAQRNLAAARERFRIGYRKLMTDAKNADRTYSLTVTEARITETWPDTATIVLKVQRLP